MAYTNTFAKTLLYMIKIKIVYGYYDLNISLMFSTSYFYIIQNIIN